MIQQELSLVPALTVAENIHLGTEPTGRLPGFVNKPKMRETSAALLRRLHTEIDVAAPVRRLRVADRQIVEIAKGLAADPRLLILDEPTSALSQREIFELLRIIRTLRDHGTACVYISHKLDEVFAVADRITVLRDGEVVRTDLTTNWSEEAVILAMVGRKLGAVSERKVTLKRAAPCLRVRNLCKRGQLTNVSFELYPGEVLGVAGLVGSGRTELVEAIFGLEPADSGVIEVEGRQRKIRSPHDAMTHGIGMVPEDRRRRGIVPKQAISANLSLPWLRLVARLGWVRRREETRRVASIAQAVDIRSALTRHVRLLSGGNQQKVVIAKWLELAPSILFLDEPTRGIDVGAKAEIYRIIERLAKQEIGVLVVSSELPEILRISDRILVMRAGQIVGEMARSTATEEAIMKLAAGTERAA
jgi:ABC-type sugar transport system ATPase subunit